MTAGSSWRARPNPPPRPCRPPGSALGDGVEPVFLRGHFTVVAAEVAGFDVVIGLEYGVVGLGVGDALPGQLVATEEGDVQGLLARAAAGRGHLGLLRSEEHTSELQSRGHLVCRLL